MKKFEFRLNSVLRWRQAQLQAERAKLTTLLGHEQKLKLELESLRNQRNEAAAFLHQGERFETVELRALSTYLIGTSSRETFLQEEIARRQHGIQQQRQRVLFAERNVKLLEKLHDKRLELWTAEFHKQIDAAAEEAWLAAHYEKA